MKKKKIKAPATLGLLKTYQFKLDKVNPLVADLPQKTWPLEQNPPNLDKQLYIVL